MLAGGNQALSIDPTQRIRFEVRATDVDTPNTMAARIYNLAPDTVNTIWQSATSVILQAGYQQNAGQIFQGDVKQIRKGAEDAKDTYIDIFAADGDKPYTLATVNQSFPAGTSDAQILATLAHAMKLPQAPTNDGALSTGGILPRGKVMFGMARAYMGELANRNNARWSIQNGVLTLIPNGGYLPRPGEATVISPQTGMVGVPEQTEQGIFVRCYLNPLIQIGQLVRIDAQITQSKNWGVVQYPTYTGTYFGATVSGSGLYRVMVAEHVGDSRANEWITELTCLAVDETAAANGKPAVNPL